eukprot:COSAG02_NODE_2593_length_8463_cov_4.133309_1_plen_26_part_10
MGGVAAQPIEHDDADCAQLSRRGRHQ